jgi:ribosomal protein S27AE
MKKKTLRQDVEKKYASLPDWLKPSVAKPIRLPRNKLIKGRSKINPMTTPKETCPKCGVGIFGTTASVTRYKCGTSDYADDVFVQSDRCRITELEKENERLRTAAKRVLSIEKRKAQMRADYSAGTCNAEDAWKEFGKWESESWNLLRASTLLDPKGGKTE